MEDYNIIRRTDEHEHFKGDEYLPKGEWIALTECPKPEPVVTVIPKKVHRSRQIKTIKYKDWILNKTFNLWFADNSDELQTTFETFIEIYTNNNATFEKRTIDIFKAYSRMVFKSNLHDICKEYDE